MGTILMIGCGKLGSEVGLQLAQHHQVIAVRKSKIEPPGNIQPIYSDITQDDLAAKLPQQVDKILVILSTQREVQHYELLYHQGLGKIIQFYEQHPPKRLIFVSSTRVYGHLDERWVNELSLTNAHDFRGKTLLQAEHNLIRSKIPTTIVRLSGLYGPTSSWLLRALQQGKALPKSTRFLNSIHASDAAGILIKLIEHKNPRALYLASDGNPMRQHELIDQVTTFMKITNQQAYSSKPIMSNQRCRSLYLNELDYTLKHTDACQGHQDIHSSNCHT